MNLNILLTTLKETGTRHLVAHPSSATINVVASSAAKPVVAALIRQESDSPVIIITAEPKEARRLYDELQLWCPPNTDLYLLPEPDSRLDGESPDPVNLSERLRVLSALTAPDAATRKPVVVTSTLAAAAATASPSTFVSGRHVLKVDTTADPVQLLTKWQGIGYEIGEFVEMPGTASRRGGILDIFPPGDPLPSRLEFFGNTIESIRLFDPQNQKTVKTADSVTIVPAGNTASGQNCVLDYLPEHSLLILDAPDDILETLEETLAENKSVAALTESAEESAASPVETYLTVDDFAAKIQSAGKRVLLQPFGEHVAEPGTSLDFHAAPSYGGKLDLFIRDLKNRLQDRERVVIVSHQASRIKDLLEEQDILTPVLNDLNSLPAPGTVALLQGYLTSGWILKNAATVFSDVEVFGFVKQRRLAKKRPVPGQWFHYQLSPGDYIVHIDHGIGKFVSLLSRKADGVDREYLILEYAAGDRLYVPTDQIDRVTRYVGADNRPVTLSRLGTQEWNRTKQKIKESVANVAKELLALSASRELVQGFAFSPDTAWQQELEAAFPYVETPDQMDTIRAVKADMERTRPMDRLVCGDVGYGKTEVALRAAFKAVMDSKQVALLVPTTILAQQHFNTFRERLQAFPTQVEMLSRFCSEDEQKATVLGVAEGSVDICIGTHRLLQKDIKFKDLGLVIVDEEQRFGVMHKERLKQFRNEVDVLTLSATPIPRTLHMSLAGIKDMSVMETPPGDRLPIKTYVGPLSDALMREAIIREIERNGQVFLVHNRINNIGAVTAKIQSLVPEARLGTAHGRMPEEQLEEVMTKFAAGETDVLVTTVIIESGLDMPNVNTLIVNQSDRFGLGQLYQLRGRIGRGSERAFAYFLYDKGKKLTHQATQRLETIFEATELGAGFGIAMKDLEIRGAGNLLGVEQSGYIASVGFDLYCTLLAEAVDNLRVNRPETPVEERVVETPPPTISLPLTAYIPEEYVPKPATRITMYHKLAKVTEQIEIASVTQEFKDRFGTIPQPVTNLLNLLEIKLLAVARGIQTVNTEGDHVILTLAPGKKIRKLPFVVAHSAVRAEDNTIRFDKKRFGAEWLKYLKITLEEVVVT